MQCIARFQLLAYVYEKNVDEQLQVIVNIYSIAFYQFYNIIGNVAIY